MKQIIVTREMVNTARVMNLPIEDVIENTYGEEIAKRKEENKELANLSPIKFAMMDGGIGKKSKIKDMISTKGNGAESWLLPAFIETTLRESIEEDSMLMYLCTLNIGVDSRAILSATLDLVYDEANKEATELKRVAEGADIPSAKIRLTEAIVKLFKRGRRVDITYEAIQEMRIDLFKRMLELFARDIADQQMADAIEVLVKGDGGTYPDGTANTIKTVTTATANIIVSDDIINTILALHKQSKLKTTTILTDDVTFGPQLFKMLTATDVKAGPAGDITFKFPQFDKGEINVIMDSRVPKIGNKTAAIFINSDYALAKYTLNGSKISEQDKNIINQTQVGTYTETAGFSKFNNYASIALVSK